MIAKPVENNTIIVKLEYALSSDFAVFYSNKNYSYYEFNVGKDWNIFQSASLTFKLQSKFQKTSFGVQNKTVLEFMVGGEEIDFIEDILALINAKLVFRITYFDGSQKIMGSTQKPCYIEINNENNITSMNNFIVENNEILRFISETPYPAAFSTGFSFGFNS